MARGFSRDMKHCHGCFLAYENIYYTVALVEQLYEEWSVSNTSAFLIFSKITDAYKYMEEVERLCMYKEFWIALKTRFLSFNLWTGGIGTRIGSKIMDVLT